VSLSKDVEDLMSRHGLQRSYTAPYLVRTDGNQLDTERINAVAFGMRGRQLLQAPQISMLVVHQLQTIPS
jgi:hypothetical protein